MQPQSSGKPPMREGTFLYQLMALPGRELIRLVEFWIRRAAGHEAFLNTAQFPWVEVLEAHAKTIRDELLTLLHNGCRIPEFHQLSSDQARITDGVWKSFMLYTCGYPMKRNGEQCLKTTRLLQSIPGMKSGFFSILEPHTHLTPHRGVFNGFIRYHLALLVPNNTSGCGLRVNGETRCWETGKSLIFDDTQEHEAWNDTDQIRAVLVVDIARPLPFPLSLLNEAMIRLIGISPFVQNILKNQERLHRNDAS